jgi:pantoate--beta-alanine ligase
VLILDSLAALWAWRREWTGMVGLVPTMGALHPGHLSLVRQAALENDAVLVSIFVNPTQFNSQDDLSRYPRPREHDLALLKAEEVEAVFIPTVEVMYPPGFQTWVNVERVSQGLEGERRPGHFRGVATIVSKLFNLVQPNRAYFGQKDAQQVAVIKALRRDLDFPVDVIVCPTVRETDGLAMSSRNVHLTADQRQAASVLYRALRACGGLYAAGERSPDRLRQRGMEVLHNEPLAEPEYVSLADAVTLQEVDAPSAGPLLLSMTVRFGQTRLLDNLLLPLELNSQEHLTATLGGDGRQGR